MVLIFHPKNGLTCNQEPWSVFASPPPRGWPRCPRWWTGGRWTSLPGIETDKLCLWKEINALVMRSNLKWQMEENFSRGHKNINSLQKTLYLNAALVNLCQRAEWRPDSRFLRRLDWAWTESSPSPGRRPTPPVAYRGTRLQSSSCLQRNKITKL